MTVKHKTTPLQASDVTAPIDARVRTAVGTLILAGEAVGRVVTHPVGRDTHTVVALEGADVTRLAAVCG